MIKRTVILGSLLAGAAFGQSGIFNVPYKPQPHVMIPYVESPKVIVTASNTVEPNPYRNLKYCDFVLKAVEQPGEGCTTNRSGYTTPVYYVYSSVSNICADFADTNPAVFFQDAGSLWPHNTQRIQVKHETFTNWTYEAWPDNPAASSSPDTVTIYSNIVLQKNGEVNLGAKYGPETIGSLTYTYARSYNTQGGYWTLANFNNGVYIPPVWVPSSVNFFWTIQVFDGYSTTISFCTNFFGGIVSCDPPGKPTPHVYHGGAIGVVSSNTACAVEIYPTRTPANASWMKPGNPKIKWMCALSNGIDFYRDAAGNLVWFNVDVEWVDKIPDPGRW